MQLALNGVTALRMLRCVRRRPDGLRLLSSRAELCAPDPGEDRRRFTKRLLAEALQGYPGVQPTNGLCVAGPNQKNRLRLKGVQNTVYVTRLRHRAFVQLEDGLQISSPELLFVEMAAVMPFYNLVLLGFELCGTYARDPANPHDGPVSYNLAPATTAARIVEFTHTCGDHPGLSKAREASTCVLDNAWSPMEAVIAALLNMPADRLGYDLAPIQMNEKVSMPSAASKTARIPDMLVYGARVGLNYDGSGHLDLASVVDSATKVAGEPGSEAVFQALQTSVSDVRAKYVDDRRRDRELGASGYRVFVVTKEDLVEQGGLDQVVSLVLEAVERETGATLTWQRGVIALRMLARLRQDLVWSAFPGELGKAARARIASRRSARQALIGKGIVSFVPVQRDASASD